MVDGRQVSKVRRRVDDSSRLDVNAWTDAALSALARHGIDRVRVELLAKDLSVTKGSFYWHFKDRDALLAMMLDRWRKRATLGLIERIDRAASSPRERLQQLLQLPFKGRSASQAADVELAIRLWGRSDPRASAALAEVDELRLRYIATLFEQAGLPADLARPRAVLVYAYQRVASTLASPDDHALIGQCETLLIGIEPTGT